MRAYYTASGLVLFLALAHGVTGQPPEPPKAKTDYEKWEGRWSVPEDKRGGMAIVVKGRQVTLVTPNKPAEALRLRLDTEARPRTFDFVLNKVGHPFDGRSILFGVYEFISDDELEVSMAHAGQGRPKTFSDAPNVVLKRVR